MRYTLLFPVIIMVVVVETAAARPAPARPGVISRPQAADNVLTFGDYSYSTNAAGHATIIGFNKDYTGVLAITNTLGGCPVTSIANNAFSGCTNLTSITIPTSVSSIGFMAFSQCTGLINVTFLAVAPRIDRRVFDGCSGLTNVTLAASVTNFCKGMLWGASNLTAISVASNNAIYSSMDGVLFDKNKTALLECPAGKAGIYAIPAGIVTIGQGAFSGCSDLTSVTIPPGVTRIPQGAFSGCSGLTRVTIPANVTSIDYAAFLRCSGLTSVTIPASVTNIGTLPKYFSRNSGKPRPRFPDCSGLLAINVGSNNTTYSSLDGVLFDKNKTTILEFPAGRTGSYAIPYGVKTIDQSAFSGCTNLTSITIPASVTNIEAVPFGSGRGKNATAMLRLPGCSGLTAIDIDSTNTVYSSVDGVLFDKKQTTLITYPAGKAGSYTIPFGVAVVGQSAFFRCTALPSVTVPASVTSIDDYAFYACTGLTNITISASVTNIGARAFLGCTRLPGFPISASVTSIGQDAFSRCSNLSVINVDEANSSYSSEDGVLFHKGKNELIRCPDGKVGDYVIPTGVTRVGELAFADCTSLTSVTVPFGVTSIWSYAFYGCTGLTNVAIPSSATSIAGLVFLDCTNLTSVTIPGTGIGTGVGDAAYYGLRDMTNITVLGNATRFGKDAFQEGIVLPSQDDQGEEAEASNQEIQPTK